MQQIVERFGPIQNDAPFLEGKLIKKNKFTLKQERCFRFFIDGQLKYYDPSTLEEKGTINLDKDSKLIQKGSDAYEIVLPSKQKIYHLISNIKKNSPPWSRNSSCDIKDWVEAIELIIQLKAL